MNRIIVFLIFFMFSTSPLANINQNKIVLVINASSHAIVYIYGSNIGRTRWEEDILGNIILWPGNSVPIDFEDGTNHCRYDLRAVTLEGYEIIRRNVDLCNAQSWTLTN
jgi:hypothetical protein